MDLNSLVELAKYGVPFAFAVFAWTGYRVIDYLIRQNKEAKRDEAKAVKDAEDKAKDEASDRKNEDRRLYSKETHDAAIEAAASAKLAKDGAYDALKAASEAASAAEESVKLATVILAKAEKSMESQHEISIILHDISNMTQQLTSIMQQAVTATQAMSVKLAETLGKLDGILSKGKP